MEVKFPNIYTRNTAFPQYNYPVHTKQYSIRDSFEHNKTSISFCGINSFFKKFKKQVSIDQPIQNFDENVSDFTKELSIGIKSETGKNIPPQNLKNIMSPTEFKELLPNLTSENFISANKDKKVYCIDLDYQSNFSRGKENVYEILDKAAKYADEYYAKTNKKFVFALTDRDTLDGVKHAIRIIGENPEKYKNLKFVPAIKISYAHKAPNSKLKYESSDMLVYGINPYSVTLSNFIENLITKRKTMIISFIKEVNTLYPEFSYNLIEFAQQNNIKYKRDFTLSNLYWRAREYAETKGDTAIKGLSLVPKEVVKEANDIIDKLGEIYIGSDKKAFSVLGSQIIEDSEVNKSIKNVFETYSTHEDKKQGKVVSSAENLYDEMITCLSLQKEKPIIALCSPYYFSHYFEKNKSETFPNVVNFIKELQAHSDGMLLAFESVAPIYDLDANLRTDTIKTFNNYIRKHTDLYEVGGSFAKLS